MAKNAPSLKSSKLIIILCVVITVALGMVGWLAISSEPVKPQNENERIAANLMQVAKETCLSGNAVGVDVGIDLDKAFSAALKASAETKKGAVDFLNEEIRGVQNDAIRECLEKSRSQIEACLLGDCDRASISLIDVELRMTFLDQNDARYKKDIVVIGVVGQPNPELRTLPQPGGQYQRAVPFPKANQKVRGMAAREVVDSFKSDYASASQFCLERPTRLPAPPPLSRLACIEGRACMADTLDPGWLAVCPTNIGFAPPTFGLWSSAFAQDRRPSWTVPSLGTLQQRRADGDVSGVGFTEFQVTSAQPLDVDADGYSYDLRVNGKSVNVDGLPPEFRVRPFERGAPFALEFALQNLDFAGQNAGCDTIGLDVEFYRDGEKTGQAASLERSYVALRDARPREFTTALGQMTWTGAYRRPVNEFDHEVFVRSILKPALDTPWLVADARKSAQAMKAEFDALNIYRGSDRLTGTIRPPLTQLSFGIAVAKVLPSGQVQFTYELDEANALKNFLLDFRARNTGEIKAIANIIQLDSFVYRVRGEPSAPPLVCPDEAETIKL